MRIVLALIVLAAPALADCPPAPDHADRLAELSEQARQGAAEARVASAGMWELWTDAPDEVAQEMLDEGMARREAFDFLGALDHLDRLVAYCPDYAEGYNQRAFVNFLRQDYSRALPDLDRAIVLSPRHAAALSGRALTLLALGRVEEARDSLKQALELNPWLPERGLAAPGGPLAPPGEDI